MTRLYGATIFLSALLLFLVQPMAGKMVLPRFGGTPAVWNTCLVFYQALLLAGYAYAHFSCRLLGVRRQALLHIVVLIAPLTVLPIAFPDDAVPPTQSNPTIWLLLQLLVVVGMPFFAVATTSPLIQRWLHQTDFHGSDDPYYLYATSNAGSLLALLGYPIIIEPWLPLAQQSDLWTWSYVLLAILIVGCVLSVLLAIQRDSRVMERRAAEDSEHQRADFRDDSSLRVNTIETISTESMTSAQRVRWVALALVPSSLMMGVTTHVTTDIASVPLLWVLPLAIYLLTFILAFARRSLIPHRWMVRLFPYAILPAALLIYAKLFERDWLAIPLHFGSFFVVAMVCHGELARSRPNPKSLTEFYLWISVGGVLGGFINAIAAPMLFNSVAEYPLMLIAACLLVPTDGPDDGRRRIAKGDLIWPAAVAVLAILLAWWMTSVRIQSQLELAVKIGLPALICLSFQRRTLRFTLGFVVILCASAHHAGQKQGQPIYSVRGFFGVNRVTIDSTRRFHRLINGRTIHGVQEFYPGPNNEPLSYYHRSGPLGDIFAAIVSGSAKRDVAVIGLGIGSTACYIEPDQRITFFEIDPHVREIASSESLFTHLRDCRGHYEIVLGDARVQLQAVEDESYDMIVVDAFSSDSIPAHLISREAVELYLDKLRDRGVLVFHISNKYLRLRPLLAALAEQLGLAGVSRRDLVSDDPVRYRGKSSSHYVVFASHESDLGSLTTLPEWRRLPVGSTVPIWTDDYSNLLSLFAW